MWSGGKSSSVVEQLPASRLVDGLATAPSTPVKHALVGSILHGGSIELFLIPGSAPQLKTTKVMVCAILSVK